MTSLTNELAWPREAVTSWVDRELEESARSGRPRQAIVAKETALEFEIPYGVFDSPYTDARLFATRRELSLARARRQHGSQRIWAP